MLNAIITIASVAAGGAIGALGRYGVGIGTMVLLGHKASFPWATLVVNVAGSFLMGVVIVMFGQVWQPPAALRIAIVTGFLGAFTTFSTFSLDTVSLYERGEILSAGLYAGASVILSISALVLGMWLSRSLIS